jgi:DNA-binding response OmpR family regulator
VKILYVEHDDDNLYMLKTRLERCGDFEVLAAEDSEQGCKLAVTEHPDVILIERHDFGRFRTVSTRAREGECELGTLAIGKRCQERISATGWAW